MLKTKSLRVLDPLPDEIKITYHDYTLLQDIDKRYEIIEGRLTMVPAPAPYHQQVSIKLENILYDFVCDNELGEVICAPCDVVLSKTDVVQPDIFFISKERLSIIGKTRIKGAPDLVIEIISPLSGSRDRIIKKKLYAEHYVKEYWVVEPNKKTLEIFWLNINTYELIGNYRSEDIIESRLLAGLRFNLKRIF